MWGGVNNNPELFDNKNGFSSSEVVNTAYGYHSDVSGSTDNRQNSNDPAVSSNKYKLKDDRHVGYTGSGRFEAHRETYSVSDADGPDGTGNGLIAFNEEEGVQGVTEGLFESEYWNGANEDFISENDLPDPSCPGDSVRCIIPVDISTKQQGWGTDKTNSFTINYN